MRTPSNSRENPVPAQFNPYSILGGTVAQAALPGLYKSARQPSWTAWLRKHFLRNEFPSMQLHTGKPIDTESGAILNQLMRILDARLTLLLGTSAGITAIWLANALRNGGRRSGDRGIVAWEPTAIQAQIAHKHLRGANLSRYVDLHHGHDHVALQRVDYPVDLIVLDCDPAFALPLLKPLLPKLRAGGAIVASGLNYRKKHSSDYLHYIRDPGSGYNSIRLSTRGGLEISVKT